MIRWMFRCEITSVEWMTSYPKIEKLGIVSYNTMGMIRLSNGMVGSLYYSSSVAQSASESRLEVFGDNTNVLHAVGTNNFFSMDRTQNLKKRIWISKAPEYGVIARLMNIS